MAQHKRNKLDECTKIMFLFISFKNKKNNFKKIQANKGFRVINGRSFFLNGLSDSSSSRLLSNSILSS